MNKIVKDALILTAITLIAGFALGAVYQITKKPIEVAQENSTQEAYSKVFEDAATITTLEKFDSSKSSEKTVAAAQKEANKIIAATNKANSADCKVQSAAVALDKDGNILGYVIEMQSKGFGGYITFAMGVKNDGTLNGYSITDISETPGLGMHASDDSSDESSFAHQFVNVVISDLSKGLTLSKEDSDDANTVTAISGATITSKSMTYGVNAGLVYAQTLIQGGAK